MSAHSPGPWKVVGPFDGAARERYEVQSEEVSIASLYVDHFDHEAHSYARRDARLIAAAPDLLAALERVVSESSKPTDPDAERWDHDITKPDHWVQEVLAKARGGK